MTTGPYKNRQRHIFPGSRPPSIFCAGELNFCVRDGYRWILSAIATGSCLSFSAYTASLVGRSDPHVLRYAPVRSPSRSLSKRKNPAHFACLFPLLLRRRSANPVLTYSSTLRSVCPPAPCLSGKILLRNILFKVCSACFVFLYSPLKPKQRSQFSNSFELSLSLIKLSID